MRECVFLDARLRAYICAAESGVQSPGGDDHERFGEVSVKIDQNACYTQRVLRAPRIFTCKRLPVYRANELTPKFDNSFLSREIWCSETWEYQYS